MFILDAGNSHHTFPGKVLQDGFLPWRWKRYSQEDLASPLDVSIHQLQPHPSPFLTPSSGTWVIWFLGWEELKSSRCQWWRCWEGSLFDFFLKVMIMIWWFDGMMIWLQTLCFHTQVLNTHDYDWRVLHLEGSVIPWTVRKTWFFVFRLDPVWQSSCPFIWWFSAPVLQLLMISLSTWKGEYHCKTGRPPQERYFAK